MEINPESRTDSSLKNYERNRFDKIVLARDADGKATDTIPFAFQKVPHGNVPTLTGDFQRALCGGAEEE